VFLNELWITYTTDYKALEIFATAANKLRNGSIKDSQYFDPSLATISSSISTTAILAAGRKSLDNSGKSVEIVYENQIPVRFELESTGK